MHTQQTLERKQYRKLLIPIPYLNSLAVQWTTFFFLRELIFCLRKHKKLPRDDSLFYQAMRHTKIISDAQCKKNILHNYLFMVFLACCNSQPNCPYQYHQEIERKLQLNKIQNKVNTKTYSSNVHKSQPVAQQKSKAINTSSAQMRDRSSLLQLNKQVAKSQRPTTVIVQKGQGFHPSYSPLANLSSAQQTATTGFPPNFLPCNAVFALAAPSISAYSRNTCNRKFHASEI